MLKTDLFFLGSSKQPCLSASVDKYMFVFFAFTAIQTFILVLLVCSKDVSLILSGGDIPQEAITVHNYCDHPCGMAQL